MSESVFKPGEYKTVCEFDAVVLEEFGGMLFGRVCCNYGKWSPVKWSLEGVQYTDSPYNLVQPKIVRHINIYPSSGYSSRAEADRTAMPNRIACVRVEWREGQFDD